MRYYVIELQRDKQGADSNGIFAYNSKEEAIDVFYAKMASGRAAVHADTLSFVSVLVMNDMGNIEKMDRCVGTEESPEPEM